MKKLNLKKLKLEAEDVLQRSQMAGFYGGSGASGTCGWDGGNLTSPFCGISREAAIDNATEHEGNWCCDSCSSTWYCGNGSGW